MPKITTIKLENEVKQRLDSLKEYPRETYNDVIKKTLNIFNITIRSPESGARILRKIKLKKTKKEQAEYYKTPKPITSA
jgi:predicted DNA-binding protein